MNDSPKKLLNIISYALNIVFITFLIIGIRGNHKTDDTEEIISAENTLKNIKECIIQQENANLPLTKQSMDNVNSIKIDSLVITTNIEPYSGYLVTTWNITEQVEMNAQEWAANGYKDKFVKKNKVVYVEISNIRAKSNGEVSWNNNWTSAYLSTF